MSDEWPPPTEEELRGQRAERVDDEERERRRARGDWGPFLGWLIKRTSGG